MKSVNRKMKFSPKNTLIHTEKLRYNSVADSKLRVTNSLVDLEIRVSNSPPYKGEPEGVKKKFLIPKLLLLFFFILSSASFSFSQTSKDDLEKKKEQLVKEIASLQKELDATKSNKKVNLAQLTALQKKIKAREKLISSYNGEIYQINKAINNKITSVKAMDRDLDTLKINYAKMIYYAYKHRSAYNKLLFLFSADDFNDAFTRLKYIRRYNA
ncbi:MAG: hypothetical protein LH473_08385, partial [Chitinophagales bacterium]|nr:hypothetical protein [Chitinophagales bacterium]